jgi:hypothetical protein
MLVKILNFTSGEQMVVEIISENEKTYEIRNPLVLQTILIHGKEGKKFVPCVNKYSVEKEINKDLVVTICPTEQLKQAYIQEILGHIKKEEVS